MTQEVVAPPRRRGLVAAAAVISLSAARDAHAHPWPSSWASRSVSPPSLVPPSATASPSVSVTDLYDRARSILSRVARERALAARRPTPVAVRWSPRRIATLDLGGDLGAMIGADLDRDGKAELYAATERALLAYTWAGGKLRERSRLAFGGDAAPIRPRDEVVVVAVDPESGDVLAGSSSFARSVRARWRDGALVSVEELPAMPLCAHRRGRLFAGRNTFAEVVDERAAKPSPVAELLRAENRELYGERCRDLVLADGQAAEALARLAVDAPLEITVTPQCTAPPCATPRVERYEIAGAGVSFDLGDLDRDGRVEVAYAGAGAPGDPDAVRVVTAAEPRKTLARRAFTGGVAALTMMDLDGDGALEVIVAVRLPGSPRVDVWRLNG